MKMVRVDDRRLCLVRTSDGVFALDHACPHEGYGMTQGSLDGNLITCAWHNWKFRVDDGTCVVGEEDINTHPATVDDDGAVQVTLRRPDPEAARPRLLASLRRGVERDYIGQVSRDVVRLAASRHQSRASSSGRRCSTGHRAPEFGWGHSIASATDCLAMVDLYEGDQRALPIVQAIAGIAETERDRPVNPLPEPARQLPADPLRRVPRRRREPSNSNCPGTGSWRDPRRPDRRTICGRGSPPSSAIICCRTGTARSTARRRSNCST